MKLEDVARYRLHNNHLSGKLFDTPIDVVRWFGGVQSQDYPGAKWGVAQRVKGGIKSEDIDVLFNAGKILRTHVMRPTWHFVDPQDIRWMLELTKPRVKSLMGHYNRKLELTDTLFAKTAKMFTRALEGKKHLTRQELKTLLTKEGIKTDVQRLAHIVMWAELDGVICSGASRGKLHTYALLKERVPGYKTASGFAQFDRNKSLYELAKRYFTSHGPATVHDFSWWSGLTIVDCKKAIELNKNFLSEEIDGKKYWFTDDSVAEFSPPLVQLLPNYDEYLIAYKGYAAIFDPLVKQTKETYSSLINHILVIDGKVAGGWKRTFEKKIVVVTLRLLRDLSAVEKKAVQTEAENFAKFLQLPLVIKGL